MGHQQRPQAVWYNCQSLLELEMSVNVLRTCPARMSWEAGYGNMQPICFVQCMFGYCESPERNSDHEWYACKRYDYLLWTHAHTAVYVTQTHAVKPEVCFQHNECSNFKVVSQYELNDTSKNMCWCLYYLRLKMGFIYCSTIQYMNSSDLGC